MKNKQYLKEVKHFQKLAGVLKEWHPDKEWDEEGDEEDNGQDYPSDEELFGLDEDGYSIPDDVRSGDTAKMGNID